MIVKVLTELKIRKLDRTFDYKVPKHLEKDIEVGKRVLVDFNNRKLEGFVLEITNKSEIKDLKEIISVIDDVVILNDELKELGKFMSNKTLSTLMSSYQSMLPKALKPSYKSNVGKKFVSIISINKLKEINYNKTQTKILNILKEEKEVLRSRLNEISRSSVNTLLKHEIIKEEQREIYRYNLEKSNYPIYKLTNDQQKVVDEVLSSSYELPFLLHGVTGSGKTEVYMEIIQKVIEDNKQVIVLVPEISLTPQIINRFSSRFEKIAILHSKLSDGEKYDEYRKIINNEVNIVIGARSAIFAPFKNLGLIVIDEEHSTTYSQENNPKYHVIDIAMFRMKYHKAKVLLGSATPKLESMARAKKGVFHLLELKKRVNNKELPKTHIIDLSSKQKRKSFYFSNELYDAISERLNNDEQIILFLNRRGHSPWVSCSSCGNTRVCPHCDISLTYHKSSNMLRCHYCGYADKHNIKCDVCSEDAMTTLGIGTEKLQEEVIKLFDKAKPIRMDYDTTTTKNAHENIINDFASKKYNILIGTQMISKGLDFPDVTLVGIVNADNSLNIPDFRSSEYTYQLLEQVSGRSGRGEKEGLVIIQTFNKDHYAIEHVKDHNYDSFYKKEMDIRKILKYPPYVYLTLITISSKDYNNASTESINVSKYLKRNLNNVIVLGPSIASLFKIKNVYHFQVIIKSKVEGHNLKILKDLIKIYESKDVDLNITFNPTRMT